MTQEMYEGGGAKAAWLNSNLLIQWNGTLWKYLNVSHCVAGIFFSFSTLLFVVALVEKYVRIKNENRR